MRASCSILLTLITAVAAGACSKSGPTQKRVAVGAQWDPDAEEKCEIISAEPTTAVAEERRTKAMAGGDELIVHVLEEGVAAVKCQGVTYRLQLVTPASIQVQLAESTDGLKASEHKELLALLTISKKDKDGGDLDSGRGIGLRGVKWMVTSPFAIADGSDDPERGKEMAHIKVTGPGKGIIKATWRGLSSEIEVEIE